MIATSGFFNSKTKPSYCVFWTEIRENLPPARRSVREFSK